MKSTLNPIAALVASVALVVVAGASSAGAAPEAPVVTIDNFAFAPVEISIPAGTTLTWTNQQAARHTTTSDTGVWDSDVMARDQSFAFTFDQAGDFAYHCDIHPEMLGVVHVVAAVAAAPVDEPVVEAAPIEEAAPVEVAAPAEVVVVAEPAPAPVAPTVAPTVAPAPTLAPPAPTAKPQPAYVYPTPTPKPASSYYGY
jgi:plastocyanin